MNFVRKVVLPLALAVGVVVEAFLILPLVPSGAQTPPLPSKRAERVEVGYPIVLPDGSAATCIKLVDKKTDKVVGFSCLR